MKKYIEWAQKEIDGYLSYEGAVDARNALMFAKGVISRLGELETLSFDWIEDNKKYSDVHSIGYYVPIDRLHGLIVPKQERVRIPKYVAEWITNHREKFDLYPALRTLENNTLVWGLIYKWYRANTHYFVNAYLTGEYEVEEAQKYFALIKGHELLKGEGDWVVPTYWYLDTTNGNMFIGDRITVRDKFLIEMGKSEWNELGINDSNADFIEVEEMEGWQNT